MALSLCLLSLSGTSPHGSADPSSRPWRPASLWRSNLCPTRGAPGGRICPARGRGPGGASANPPPSPSPLPPLPPPSATQDAAAPLENSLALGGDQGEALDWGVPAQHGEDAQPGGVPAATGGWRAPDDLRTGGGGALGGQAAADYGRPPLFVNIPFPARGGGGAFADQPDDGDDSNFSRANSRIANAFDAAAVEFVYNSGPRILGFERPPRLGGPGTFPLPFRPTGDTAFAAEFSNGSRNSIEAELLFIVCTRLRHINNSLADWEDGNRASPPTLDDSSDVRSTTRTHIFKIYVLLALRYGVVLTWRTDPGWAAAVHDAILDRGPLHKLRQP